MRERSGPAERLRRTVRAHTLVATSAWSPVRRAPSPTALGLPGIIGDGSKKLTPAASALSSDRPMHASRGPGTAHVEGPPRAHADDRNLEARCAEYASFHDPIWSVRVTALGEKRRGRLRGDRVPVNSRAPPSRDAAPPHDRRTVEGRHRRRNPPAQNQPGKRKRCNGAIQHRQPCRSGLKTVRGAGRRAADPPPGGTCAPTSAPSARAGSPDRIEARDRAAGARAR